MIEGWVFLRHIPEVSGSILGRAVVFLASSFISCLHRQGGKVNGGRNQGSIKQRVLASAVNYSTLKMEIVFSSETPINFYLELLFCLLFNHEENIVRFFKMSVNFTSPTWLIFSTEDGGNMFLQNVVKLLLILLNLLTFRPWRWEEYVLSKRW